MGTSNGYVVGLAKVHDEGSPSDRLNVVLVAEGYQVGELAQFASDVDDLVAHLFGTPPFDEDAVACGMNVYRLDVVSDESGADDPVCDGDGDPVTADTYFDATFCGDGEVQRSISGDYELVQSTVETYLPEWSEIVVLVNATQRGGTGGSIAWSSTGGYDWQDTFVHELGHAAFGLADEYDYKLGSGADEPEQDQYDGAEPMQVNVTTEPDPTLVKWAALVTAASAVPTMSNADCSAPNNAASPVAADIVGTFEGAFEYHCGVYRPMYACKMRALSNEFCPVCQDRIRAVMAEYSVPTTGAVTLDTPFVTFDDIPEGTATVRPVVFTVDTCLPVTFEVTVPPAAPFTVAYGPVVVSNPDPGPVRLARVWIRYDCGNAGSVSDGAVSIRLVETDFTWAVPLSGNCVPRETAVVQLVFDQSSSMLDLTSEGRLKKDVLKDSARVLADVAYEDTGLGANTYDHDAHPLMDVEVAGPISGGAGTGRDALRTAIDTYEPNPAGNTATGDGIEFAKAVLDETTGYDNRAMIVLTDGKDTASKTVGEVADGVINEAVFAIGMGTAEQINPETLETLAGATGGHMLMTGLLTEDDTFLLEKFYLQILAGITNNDIIIDPEGRLSPAAPMARIPFDVAESDIEITAITLATMTQPVDLSLEAPNGEVFGALEAIADPLMAYAKSADSIVLRASLPLVSDAVPQREGRWHLILTLDEEVFYSSLRSLPGQFGDVNNPALFEAHLKMIEDLRLHGVKYSAVVQTYSNLNMTAQLAQSSHQPGAVMSVSATLTEYGGPFFGSAHVAADVTLPNDTVIKVQLDHQGEGLFTAQLLAASPGLYSWRIRASGTTQRGRPFTREQLRTASVWTGGDQPGDGPHLGGDDRCDEGLIDLLCCLDEHDGLRGTFDERLKDWGIDPDVFRRCLQRLCRHRDATPKPDDLRLTSEQRAAIRALMDRLATEFLDGLN